MPLGSVLVSHTYRINPPYWERLGASYLMQRSRRLIEFICVNLAEVIFSNISETVFFSASQFSRCSLICKLAILDRYHPSECFDIMIQWVTIRLGFNIVVIYGRPWLSTVIGHRSVFSDILIIEDNVARASVNIFWTQQITERYWVESLANSLYTWPIFGFYPILLWIGWL